MGWDQRQNDESAQPVKLMVSSRRITAWPGSLWCAWLRGKQRSHCAPLSQRPVIGHDTFMVPILRRRAHGTITLRSEHIKVSSRQEGNAL